MLKNLVSHKNLSAWNADLPLQINRFFYIIDVPQNVTRGYHAHKKNDQLLVCLNGEIQVDLDDGVNESTYTLTKDKTLFIPRMTWATQKYLTGKDILLVLCSEEYNEENYIRDYEQFIQKVNNHE